MRSPAGGEIGEAPPVADEASRFRGSAPIGGHDSARQSVGTTVGKRAPPLRKRNKNCGEAGRRGRRPLQSSIGKRSVGDDAYIVPSSPHFMLRECLRRGTFCHQRQKVPKERRQNQWFWNPCAVVVRKVSKIFTLANKTTQIRSLLSHCPCVYPPRRAPRLCCPSKQGGPLRLPRGAMWGANRAPPVADEAR